MFIKGDQHAQPVRIEAIEQDRIGRPVAVEDRVRQAFFQGIAAQPGRLQGGPRLVFAAPQHEGLGLGEEIGQQLLVMVAQGIVAFRRGDEIGGDTPRSLVDQLVKGVLAVGARLAEQYRPGGGLDGGAVEGDALAVALHVQLLQVGWKTPEVLIIRQHGEAVAP